MDELKPSKKSVSKLAIASVIWAILTSIFVERSSPFDGWGNHEVGFSFLALAFIILLIALLISIAALISIKHSKGALKGKAYAVGAIIISVIMCLSPMEGRVKRLPPEVRCGNKLKGLGTAMQVYANDYKGQWPTSAKWCDLLIEKANADPKGFHCQVDENRPSSYAMNKHAVELGDQVPANMVLLFESKPGWNLVGGPELLSTENHNGKGCNIIFGDGHLEFVHAESLGKLNWGKEQ